MNLKLRFHITCHKSGTLLKRLHVSHLVVSMCNSTAAFLRAAAPVRVVTSSCKLGKSHHQINAISGWKSLVTTWSTNLLILSFLAILFLWNRALATMWKHRPNLPNEPPRLWKSFTRWITRSWTVTAMYCSHLRTAVATYVADMLTRLTMVIRP